MSHIRQSLIETSSRKLDELNQAIWNNGFTTETLTALANITEEVNNGTTLFERIPQAQQPGLSKGTSNLMAAGLICRGCPGTESEIREIYRTDDLIGEGRIQEHLVETWARIAEVFSQLRYMEKRGSGLRKIQDATALLPCYKPDRKPVFESSREFFYTTIPNVNYGMTDADFEKLTRKIHPEPGVFTQKIHPEITGKLTQKKNREDRPGHHRRHCSRPQSHPQRPGRPDRKIRRHGQIPPGIPSGKKNHHPRRPGQWWILESPLLEVLH